MPSAQDTHQTEAQTRITAWDAATAGLSSDACFAYCLARDRAEPDRRGRLIVRAKASQLAFAARCSSRYMRENLDACAAVGLVDKRQRPGRANIYTIRMVVYPQPGGWAPALRALPSWDPEPVTPVDPAPRRPAVSEVPRPPARQRAALLGLRPGVAQGRRIRPERCDECGGSIPGGRQAWMDRFVGPFWHVECAPRRE